MERRELHVGNHRKRGGYSYRHCFNCRDFKEVEKMNIGAKIKEKRLEKGMTQKELADQIKVDQSMICQIERGTKVPSLPLSIDIAKTLGCNINEFAGE